MKRIVFLFSILAVFSGCQTKSINPDPSILRVGITPRSKPMVFKENGQIMGIEADFAQQLGRSLNRQIVFVEVPWEKQIDYLEQNKTDIIMSSMTITAPRSIRINFTHPYLQSGLSALFRRKQHSQSGLIANTILNQTRRIGFTKNTTSEYYCRQRFTRATLQDFPDSQAGVDAMVSGKIDMFVVNAPVAWWQAAVQEQHLVAFPEVYNVEPLAWGIGKHNSMLLNDVNALLEKWDEDGTSKKIIHNWLPKF